MSDYIISNTGINYQVVEVATDLVIGEFSSNSEALSVALRLESGAGFSGRTPTFFVANTDPIVSREVRNLMAQK